MEKIAAFIILSQLVFNSGIAQNKNVVSAYNYLKYGELDKAKEAIDAASGHEQTSTMAKTWFYRGNVYLAIFASKDEKFKALHPDAAGEAYNSYLKAYDFDTKKIDINELNQAFASLVPALFTKGVEYYNGKKWDDAISTFEKCMFINTKFGHIDTLSCFNAGLSAERAGAKDTIMDAYDEKAVGFYRKCIELGYGGAKVYANLSDVYKKAHKEAEALQVIKEGRAKYANDQDLITAEINYYLGKGMFEEALGNLGLAIQNDPQNQTFYFARGSIYDQKKELEKAEADYKKAIELKPDYFDALYNLGALFFNNGAEIFNQANDLPLNEMKKSEELRTVANNKFTTALPYLEKAHELNPSDRNTMISLKQLYVRTNQTEKYNKINEKLNN